MKAITKNSIKAIIKIRKATSSKRDYGHALLVAGNIGMMGSAVIASKSCLRSGAGLVTASVPIDERNILQTACPEAMLIFRENKFDFKPYTVIAIGPGISTNKESEALVIHILTKYKNPIVLDADALNIISNNKNLLFKIPAKTIITPHHQEFDRLFGVHETEDARINTAVLKAKEFDIIIVLKNHITFIISSDKLYFTINGNAGLAKGGSGDALTGMILGFLAQGYKPLNAARIAVYLHALSSDITLKEQSMESMIITDVINNLGKAFKNTLD